MKKEDKKAFWVTNVTERNVSLLDLGLTIRAYSTVNLLDERHYHLTLEQLQNSAESGSLAKKKNFIKVRKLPPVQNKPHLVVNEPDFMPTRKISIVEVIQPEYEELNISDDTFAEQNAELAEIDRTPRLPKT